MARKEVNLDTNSPVSEDKEHDFQQFDDEESQISSTFQVEDESDAASCEMAVALDPSRLVYSLKELKQAKGNGMFFVKRDHIYEGYRTTITDQPITFPQCSWSIFWPNHNELVNIWSHAIPGIYFVIQLAEILAGFGVYAQFKTLQSSVIQSCNACVIIFCMFASTTYHTYGPLSSQAYFCLLKIDLIGIGFMIFGLTLCAVYIGFHNWPFERNVVMVVMSVLLMANLGFQLTPCYVRQEYECCRMTFYVCTIVICSGLAVSGRFYFGTEEEIKKYYGMLELSFFYLFLGFFFYAKKVPESIPSLQKFKFIQLYVASHGFWHIFTALNGYTLYWLAYYFNLHVEEYLDKVEAGSPEAQLLNETLANTTSPHGL